ncbi:DEAD/DEAH box helicase [Spiroplasma endosymbiont of Megaselia nigra]|uniref:DEAD/DEAH box helicase n=1 Tax=Spiroplasma endosymbiont of Megaselia nigra TaxID=2478537 RepID=UPI000F879CDE|nr:AAA domain-containing protein [Spiroplasma endosymbiont of Megaselia nigra]RUO86565.1 DNA/RNA helicase [Spiroplasma endosymbiont of Megaselia nigra]
MTLTEFTIQGDKYNNKNLLLNLYFLTNPKSKFTDDDVKNLRLKNITTFQSLDTFLKHNICIADFFVCLINDQAKIKKDKKGSEKKLYDILIRFKSITLLDQMFDSNSSLTILGDIDPEIGIVNVKNIFLTAMEKRKQEFETLATGVVLEIADNFWIDEAKLRTIFDSNVMANMKFLTSSFAEEKKRWLQYLRFQEQNLEYKRNNSCLYLNRKLTEYIKIPKTVPIGEKFHDVRFLSHNFWYVDKKTFTNKNLTISHLFEEIIIVELELLLDNLDKYSILKKLNNLSLANLQINRKYQKYFPLTLFSFNFSESYVQDGADIYDLGINISEKKMQQKDIYDFKKELIKIYMLENNIMQESDIDHETIKVTINQLEHYQIVNCFYEIKNEDEISFNELNKMIPSYGYLTYIGKGDSTLLRRSNVILDKISKNDVANPYLINYIFNIEDIKLKTQSNLIMEEQLIFASNNLNGNQQKAITKALNSQDIFLLQGPPGTGKTEFIAELVYQYAKLGKKVLISSQNHTAIDNVLTRLFKTPLLIPLRLTSDEVRKKNRFNDFNPDKLIFNNYRFIYAHLSRQYLTKWDGIGSDYENQKYELQKLKANAKMLEKEINDYNHYTQKLNTLVTERETIINKKLQYLDDNRKLTIDINNIRNLLDFLVNINWAGIVTSTPDLVGLFNKHFGELLQKKIGFQIDDSYSLTETYKKLLTITTDNRLLKDKEIELATLKQVSQDLRDDDWMEQLTAVQNEILELKNQVTLKQENIVFQKEQEAFKNDLEQLLQQYEEQSVINQNKISEINEDKYEQEISYLEIEIGTLNHKINALKVEVENIVNSINAIFNLNLVVKDISGTINEIDKEINKIEQDLNFFLQEKATKFNFVNNMITFLNKNYQISDFLTQENIETNHFTPAMERDTINNANQFLQESVNVVAMTATSNQSYAQSKNKVLRDYNISDIDIKKFAFDVVIIDEVSKLTPMEIFMPLVYGKTVILVGDYRQLPPLMPYQEEDVALINEIYDQNYSYNDFLELVTNSLFKKIISKCDDSVKEILINQYRSHEDIMRIVNVFYENQLQLGDKTNQNNEKQHYITVENKDGLKIFDSNKAIYWIDSSKDKTNMNFVYEQGESGSASLFNWLEVNLTIKTLELIEAGYNNLTVKLKKQPKVAVISFYSLHVKKLRRAIKSLKFKNIKVEVSTVDDYQGRETEIVIVNTVRNPRKQLNANKEFIKKYERLNVAFSRAKNMLIIIGAVSFFTNIDVEIPTIANPNITKTIKAYYEILRIIDSYGLVWSAKDLL